TSRLEWLRLHAPPAGKGPGGSGAREQGGEARSVRSHRSDRLRRRGGGAGAVHRGRRRAGARTGAPSRAGSAGNPSVPREQAGRVPGVLLGGGDSARWGGRDQFCDRDRPGGFAAVVTDTAHSWVDGGCGPSFGETVQPGGSSEMNPWAGTSGGG